MFTNYLEAFAEMIASAFEATELRQFIEVFTPVHARALSFEQSNLGVARDFVILLKRRKDDLASLAINLSKERPNHQWLYLIKGIGRQHAWQIDLSQSMSAMLCHHGVLVPIGDTDYIIGRAISSDLVIEDPSVSRRHAKIYKVTSDDNLEEYWFKAAASSCQVKVNNKVATSGRLNHKDMISIGPVSLAIHLHTRVSWRGLQERLDGTTSTSDVPPELAFSTESVEERYPHRSMTEADIHSLRDFERRLLGKAYHWSDAIFPPEADPTDPFMQHSYSEDEASLIKQMILRQVVEEDE